MDVQDAIASRYSCRAFLPTAIPESVVRDIVERAARAPSGGNVQPWLVHAIAGERLEVLKASLRPRFATELLHGEGAGVRGLSARPQAAVLHAPLPCRQSALRSRSAFRATDRPGRYRQFSRNYLFYDAPVGIFVRWIAPWAPRQWSDTGGFIQNIMLLARRARPAHLAQEAWTNWHKTVSAFLCASRPNTSSLRHRARLCGRGRSHQPVGVRSESRSSPSPVSRDHSEGFCQPHS